MTAITNSRLRPNNYLPRLSPTMPMRMPLIRFPNRTTTMQPLRRNIIRNLDPLNAQKDILTNPQIPAPNTAITPQINNKHAQFIRDAVSCCMEKLVILIPARYPGEPVDSMGGPQCPWGSCVSDDTSAGNGFISYGIIIWLVRIVDVVRWIGGEDLDIRFTDRRVIGEDSGAGTGWWEDFIV